MSPLLKSTLALKKSGTSPLKSQYRLSCNVCVHTLYSAFLWPLTLPPPPPSWLVQELSVFLTQWRYLPSLFFSFICLFCRNLSILSFFLSFFLFLLSFSDYIIKEKTVLLQKKDNEGFGFVLRGAKGKSGVPI